MLDVEILRLKPETRVADFAAVLETAARLGARNALVAGNDPDAARFGENFAALCDLAAPYGIAPCVEPMPWTDVQSFAQGAEAVRRVARSNAGLLIDAIHFDRAGSVASEISGVPAAWLRYAQICDAPAERPTDLDGLLHQARAERLLPGEGGLDLAGIFGALPPDTPVSVEIPMERLAKSVPALERARRALARDAAAAARAAGGRMSAGRGPRAAFGGRLGAGPGARASPARAGRPVRIPPPRPGSPNSRSSPCLH